MSIVGERPETGLRLRLVLDRSKHFYEGTATTADEQWAVRVLLEEASPPESVKVSVETEAPQDVAEYTRRVVRIAAKNAKADGVPVPRTIQRWRAPQ